MRKSPLLRRLKYPLGHIDKDGYFRVALCFIDKDGEWRLGYKYSHRVVAETHLGRKLGSDEFVHHRNEDKLDNRFENFLILTPTEHGRLHRNFRARNRRGPASPFRGSAVSPVPTKNTTATAKF